MTKIALSDAMMSALECCGLWECDDLNADEQTLRGAINGRTLTVTDENRDALYRAVNDWSNAEDEAGQKDDDMAVFSRRASKTLGTLGSKILRG